MEKQNSKNKRFLKSIAYKKLEPERVVTFNFSDGLSRVGAIEKVTNVNSLSESFYVNMAVVDNDEVFTILGIKDAKKWIKSIVGYSVCEGEGWPEVSSLEDLKKVFDALLSVNQVNKEPSVTYLTKIEYDNLEHRCNITFEFNDKEVITGIIRHCLGLWFVTFPNWNNTIVFNKLGIRDPNKFVKNVLGHVVDEGLWPEVDTKEELKMILDALFKYNKQEPEDENITSELISHEQPQDENVVDDNTTSELTSKSAEITIELAKQMYDAGGVAREFVLSVFTEEEITKSVLLNTVKKCIEIYEKTNPKAKCRRSLCEVNKNLSQLGLGKPVSAFCKLLICRDVYRNNWRPDWKDLSTYKYSIVIDGDKPVKATRHTESCILAFQSFDVRDEFLKNFKGLIEQAKELL